MFSSEIKLRVRYAETDRMGYVYYGNYAQYYEVGRVEALRELGLSYKQMEDDGVMLPVSKFNINYYKPAFYDEELIIKTYIKEIPQASIHFFYETFNKAGERLNDGETTLVFIDRKNNKPCRAPKYFLDKIQKYF